MKEVLGALSLESEDELISAILWRDAFLGPWAVYRDKCLWDPRYPSSTDPPPKKKFVAMVTKALKEGVSKDCGDTKDSLDVEYHQSVLYTSLLRNLTGFGEIYYGIDDIPRMTRALMKLTTGFLVECYQAKIGIAVRVEQVRPSKLHHKLSKKVRNGKPTPKDESRKKLLDYEGGDDPDAYDTEEEEDDSDAIIRCVCENDGDDGGMIQCDNCNVWQHMVCMGIEGQDWSEKTYYCEQCPLGSDPTTPTREASMANVTTTEAQDMPVDSTSTDTPSPSLSDNISDFSEFVPSGHASPAPSESSIHERKDSTPRPLPLNPVREGDQSGVDTHGPEPIASMLPVPEVKQGESIVSSNMRVFPELNLSSTNSANQGEQEEARKETKTKMMPLTVRIPEATEVGGEYETTPQVQSSTGIVLPFRMRHDPTARAPAGYKEGG
jgi:hypothetical protein